MWSHLGSPLSSDEAVPQEIKRSLIDMYHLRRRAEEQVVHSQSDMKKVIQNLINMEKEATSRIRILDEFEQLSSVQNGLRASYCRFRHDVKGMIKEMDYKFNRTDATSNDSVLRDLLFDALCVSETVEQVEYDNDDDDDNYDEEYDEEES